MSRQPLSSALRQTRLRGCLLHALIVCSSIAASILCAQMAAVVQWQKTYAFPHFDPLRKQSIERYDSPICELEVWSTRSTFVRTLVAEPAYISSARYLLPSWACFRQRFWWASPPNKRLAIGTAAFGWPLPCMKYNVFGEIIERPNDVSYRRVFVIRHSFGGARSTLYLPYGVIWRGLLFNSLLGYCIVAFPILMLARIRHRLQWTRNACLECNYDLSGLSGDRCPECGATREASH